MRLHISSILLLLLAAVSTHANPWFTVSPETGGKATCEVGDTILVKTYTVRLDSLTVPVTLEMLGANCNQWHVSKTRITQDDETFSVYYCPSAAGNHRATLFVDCTEATAYSTTLSFTGTATLPAATPTITLLPETLPVFTCKEQESVTDTIRVSASGCVDMVNITLTNAETPGAFTINNSQMPANVQNGLSIITFHPLTAGTYSATVTYTTAGGDTQSILLTGEATPAGSTDGGLDYDTAFHFTDQTALPFLSEHFDTAHHNRPLVLPGWQNVLRRGQHGWLTMDVVNEEEFYCAKATAFVSGLADTTSWDMWLVTPALDYTSTANQVFTFRVRGDFLSDDMRTSLTLYYIDATDTTDLYMESIAAVIPKTADESGNWYDIVVDLSGQSTIANVFYMGFRYLGPGGVEGAPTYYIDDITWGERTVDLRPIDSLMPDEQGRATKWLYRGQLIIRHMGVSYSPLGIKQ